MLRLMALLTFRYERVWQLDRTNLARCKNRICADEIVTSLYNTNIYDPKTNEKLREINLQNLNQNYTQLPPPPWCNGPPVGQGLLIVEDSRSHTDTHQAIGLLWTSDQPNADTCTRQHTKVSALPEEFEHTIPISERQKIK